MALSCTQRPKNERKLAIVFHQNGLSTVPARLIAPGSRLVGFGPHTPAPSRCGDQWRARAIADALSLAQNSTFRRARSAVHDTPPAHPSARFPPRPARDARTPAPHDSLAATLALFLSSLLTGVGLTWCRRAVSRMPLAFIAMSMICCFTPAA